jgi:ceramide glucosyltransferase
MEWTSLATLAPTALSTLLYTFIQGTYIGALRKTPRISPAPVRPWVSILKPIAGLDDELLDNLRSFADLDYPAYELLLGVASLAEPAVPRLRVFLAAHPELRARLVVTAPPSSECPNPKVAQLRVLTRVARGSVLVVSDANVRVPRDYLHGLLGPLLRPGTGLVSSLVVGSGERTLGASLDHAHLGAFIAPLVVFASRFLGHTVTIGKSMAMRKTDLERVGGWESVSHVLAEDEVLGRLFHTHGYHVELVLSPVVNFARSGSVGRTLERHARWTRMRKAIDPRAYALEWLLSPALIAAATLAVFPSTLALAMLAATLLLQVLGAALTLSVTRKGAIGLALLEPLRLGMGALAWVLAGVSRRVSWRGREYLVGAGSVLRPRTARRGLVASGEQAARARARR